MSVRKGGNFFAAHDLAGVTFYVSLCHKAVLRW